MRVFLAGGGNAEESRLLDQIFVHQINKNKPLIYIPNAMKDEKYPKCLEWFRNTINDIGITNFDMITDLGKYAKGNTSCSGIYIGGGNTTKLLSEVRNYEFDKYIKNAISTNIPVYGGSAGAIILGETILTAPESNSLHKETAKGLGILNGFSIVCHYDGKEDLKVLCKELDVKVIAIPEKSGVYIEDGNVRVIGYEPISIFTRNRKVIMDPGDTEKICKLLEIESNTSMYKTVEIKIEENLALQLVSEKRASEAFELVDSNRQYLKVWLPWLNYIMKVEDELEFIKRQIKLYEEGKAQVMFLLNEDSIIGACGFNEIKDGLAKIGVWISEEFAGRGIMTNAIEKLMDYGYSELDIRVMQYSCAVENIHSNKLAQKLRFKCLYKKEQAENLYGTWVDHNVYRLTKEEYEQLSTNQ